MSAKSFCPDILDSQIPYQEDVVEEREDGLFHIGQAYEDTPAKTLVCKKCGNNQFHVGQGDFFTALKCVNCVWETCIHDG